MRHRMGVAAILTAGLISAAGAASASAENPVSPPPQGAELDLTQPFHTRSRWRLVVTEGPPTKDYGDADAPGALTLCLRKGAAGACVSDAVTPPLRAPAPDSRILWEPHYLLSAKIVYPQGSKAAPLLLIVTGSLNSGDGDQIVATQLIAYDAKQDAFRRVFVNSTGHNNNQETRFVTEGPLRGSVITAAPQQHVPYGYWIEVHRLAPSGAYRRVLRYRSATLYNDGNPLAVIDSEMPGIQRRLGLWKPGQPLPTPRSQACLKPALRNNELWCDTVR